MAQQKSREILFRNILRITRTVTKAKIPDRVSDALFSLNHPAIEDSGGTNNNDKEQGLIAGYAYLLLIAHNMKIMLQYTGIDGSTKLFEQAANFLLTPKAVKTAGNFLDYENYVLIGTHTFDIPTDSVWDQARAISKEMKEIIIHITLEQRTAYIQEYTRSLSLIAVKKCEVRQEYINASSSIASLIKHSNAGQDLQTMTILNKWRRQLYSQSMSRLTKKFKRRSGQNSNALPESVLSKSNDSHVPGSATNPYIPGESPSRVATGKRKSASAAERKAKKSKSELAQRKKQKKKAEATQTRFNNEIASLEEQLSAKKQANEIFSLEEELASKKKASRTDANKKASKVVADILNPQLPPLPPRRHSKPGSGRSINSSKSSKSSNSTKSRRQNTRHPK